MTFQLKTKVRLFDLHCSIRLTDWDMDKEVKLATTTDQLNPDEKLNDQFMFQRPSSRGFFKRKTDEFMYYDKMSESFLKPNPWLLVNPSIACPIRYEEPAAPPPPPSGPAEATQTAQLDPAAPGPQTEPDVFNKPGDAPLLMKNDDVSCRPVQNRRKGRTTAARDNKTLKPGCWPRPPVNYCILIALALNSSHTGSLKVQQIYHFTRENFPFFQTAPDGWKNTIRHNLCFNTSFRKTCNQLCRDGKRKSCFWHLTADGLQRLMDEIRTLTGETFRQLERSMSHPDVIRTLLEL